MFKVWWATELSLYHKFIVSSVVRNNFYHMTLC